jgi:phosphatidate cytidylyltransferase
MIGRRLLTVAVALPILLVPLYLGSWPWLALVAAVAAVGVHEMVALLGRMGVAVPLGWAWTAGGLALATACGAAYDVGGTGRALLALGPFLALTVALAAFLLAPGDRPFLAFQAVFGAALYPAWLMGFLVLLRQGAMGLGTAFWVMAVVWVGDAAAYGAGSLFGGWRLVPGISPGKTLTGFVAGFLFGMATALALHPLVGLGLGATAAAGALVVVAAQFGDLAESLLKRRAGVKDSGTLLPGHGGILDRFDGVLLAAPVLYYCLALWRP